jgi:hypothetical protein
MIKALAAQEHEEDIWLKTTSLKPTGKWMKEN